MGIFPNSRQEKWAHVELALRALDVTGKKHGKISGLINKASADEQLQEQESERKLEGRLAPMEQSIRANTTEIHALQGQIRRLEEEMEKTSQMVATMDKNLSSRLDNISTLNAKANETLVQSLEALRDVIATSTAGFASNREVSERVNASVQDSTHAQVRMEYLRRHAEARAPIRTMQAFSKEIDERFEMALESVQLNRQTYNEHFKNIRDEYQQKLRTIGQHIFQVIEENFLPVVEQRVEVPRLKYQQLALEVDEERIKSRSDQLDAELDTFFQEKLKPLLDLEKKTSAYLERDVKVPFAVPEKVDWLLLPGLVLEWSAQEPTAVIGTKLSKDPGRLKEEGVGYRLEADGALDPVRNKVGPWGARTSSRRPKRALDPKEIGKLKAALKGLMGEGLVDPELKAGYDAYLDKFGLMIQEGDRLDHTVKE